MLETLATSSDHGLYAEIARALTLYFDGLFEGDPKKMSEIFHPRCLLHSAPGGKHEVSDLESYLKRVEGRPSPKSLGQRRHDAILAISATAEGAAFATLRTARAPRLFTDYLSLLRIDGRWQIVAKSFSWVELPAEG
jgi:4-oxalocrotonate tautomerase